MYRLATINNELTDEDLKLNQPIIVTGFYKSDLIILPILFLRYFNRDHTLSGLPLETNWSWALEDGNAEFKSLKYSHGYRGRWVHLDKKLMIEIEEAIERANKKSIKVVDKDGPMYCKKCNIRWNWNENAPNSAYNDLTCPNCNIISKEV